MSDQTIVQNCSPTLAGMKTGSLFSVAYSDRREINEEIRALNRRLTGKGLRAVPVSYAKGRVLIYLYRPAALTRDMARAEARGILKEKGYRGVSGDHLVAELTRHLAADKEFPHEIGLFLGYPPCDVRGFMADTRKGVKCVGCWKVYGDEEAARRTFMRYQKCTRIYCEQVRQGKPLEKLIVPTR